jgi:hypothetical protein
MSPRSTREKVRDLMARGVTDRFQVARRVGIHPEYARILLRDPSDEAAIRRSVRLRSRPDDAVRCELCGERFTVIGTHLRAHGIDLATYRERFPEAPTVAPSFRQGGLDVYADRLDIPPEEAQHWTRERIIDAIRAWAKRTGRPRARGHGSGPCRAKAGRSGSRSFISDRARRG